MVSPVIPAVKDLEDQILEAIPAVVAALRDTTAPIDVDNALRRVQGLAQLQQTLKAIDDQRYTRAGRVTPTPGPTGNPN